MVPAVSRFDSQYVRPLRRSVRTRSKVASRAVTRPNTVSGWSICIDRASRSAQQEFHLILYICDGPQVETPVSNGRSDFIGEYEIQPVRVGDDYALSAG